MRKKSKLVDAIVWLIQLLLLCSNSSITAAATAEPGRYACIASMPLQHGVLKQQSPGVSIPSSLSELALACLRLARLLTGVGCVGCGTAASPEGGQANLAEITEGILHMWNCALKWYSNTHPEFG